jgi:acetylornithine deacetylase/succinyl-diaminopimelate desuccinylase-like protein
VGGLNVLESEEAAVSFQLDARLLPEHDGDALVEEFTRAAQAWIDRLGQGELELATQVERNASGMALSAEARLVKSVQRVLAAAGLDPTPQAKPTSTEAGVFARKGCEAIVFGPGRSTGNAHTPNERIEVAQLEKACDLYESLLVELCACT